MYIISACWAHQKPHQENAATIEDARRMALECLDDPYRDYGDELDTLSICNTSGLILEKCYVRGLPEYEAEWRQMISVQ